MTYFFDQESQFPSAVSHYPRRFAVSRLLSRRAWGLLAILGLTLTLALVRTPAPTAASRPRPSPTPPTVTPFPGATWTLVDYHQNTCYFFPQGSAYSNYYGIWIQGRWRHAIDVGASQLPTGAQTWTSYAPIPPGSSDGIGSLAYVAIQLPPTTPVGTYGATLWASDGTVTESVPVVLTVQTRCGRY
jgi:hypothetical protein